MRRLPPTEKITLVGIFAIAFGFVEAAVVVYLKIIFGDFVPVDQVENALLRLPGIDFLPFESVSRIIPNLQLVRIEQVREAATVVILIAVALLAAKNARERLAYFFLAFGLWDISYYVFLRVTTGWPKTLFDPDVFFLLPVPWVGPVIAPLLISMVFILVSVYQLIKRS